MLFVSFHGLIRDPEVSQLKADLLQSQPIETGVATEILPRGGARR